MCSGVESQEDFFRVFAGSGRYESVVTVSEKIEKAIEQDRLEELFDNG